MGQKQIINSYRIKSFLSRFYYNYKKIIFVLVILMLLGIFTGVFTVIKFGGNINLSNMPNQQLSKFLTDNGSVWGIFFLSLFYLLLCVGLIIFFNFKRWMILFSVIVLLYKTYLLGFDLTIMIIMFGVAGTINVLLFIFPFDFCICVLLLLIIALAIKRNLIMCKFGSNANNIYCEIDYTRAYICIGVFMILVLVIKTLIMPIIRITIIVT